MDKIIHAKASVRANAACAFKYFTHNKLLMKWLCAVAEVEPKVGGKYELFWNPNDRENDSTIGCKILAIERGKFLTFEWRGPRQFKHFMNTARPLTCVTVTFIPQQKGSEIHLIHTGWRPTAEWDEARQWFVTAWSSAFKELRCYDLTARVKDPS